jgi:HK97 gp10 family phage protein
MPITVNNIPKFRGDMRNEMRKRLSRAAISVSRHAKQLVSVAGPSASRPGSPPHKQTGRLRASIAWELVGDDRARVGTNVKYGRYLELGTSRMSPRPWLVRSAKETTSEVTRIITARMS